MSLKTRRKRDTTLAKNPLINFTPTKMVKKESRLEALPKTKIIEKLKEIENELAKCVETKLEYEKAIESLNNKVSLLEQENVKLNSMMKMSNNKNPVVQTTLGTQTSLMEDEIQFPCIECVFVATAEMELRIHMDFVHDLNEAEFQTSFSCKVCNRKFTDKCKLMHHMKNMHEEDVQTCRFYVKGLCNFPENKCWYKHKNDSENVVKFNCGHCGKCFSDKNSFMNHRKTQHIESVQICRFYNYDKCRFEKTCWFRHDSNRSVYSNNSSKTSDISDK